MKLGVRLHYHNLVDDKGYKILMDFCDQYKEQIDEMSLFSHYSLQGYIPPEEDEDICRIYRERIADMRARGYKSVGINMLSTIGHGNEDYKGMPLPTIVGHNGIATTGSMCPTSDKFKEYTQNRYRRYAEIGPDFIWADDDCRLFYMGTEYGCFCDRCIAAFNERHSYNYSRKTLVADMNEPDNIEVRSRWIQFVEDRIADMFALIQKTVHDVSPEIELGYMSTVMLNGSMFTYTGMNFDYWLTSLDATKGRPGTSIFDDRSPLSNLIVKPMLMGVQSEDYPSKVKEILYEHDNFPYPTYRKSHVFEITECTLALANGANGLYVNSMNDRSINTVFESHPFFESIKNSRGMWNKMVRFSEGASGYGFYPAISKNYDKLRPLHFGESFFTPTNGHLKTNYSTSSTTHDVRHAYVLSQIGVPITADRKNAFGTILAGDLPDGYTDDELKSMLSRPVLMDAYALRALERRDLGHLTGVLLDKFYDENVIEHFNMEDSINNDLTEDYRDTRGFQADYGGNSGAATLIPINNSVRIISYLESFHNEPLGIAMTVYKNELGGKICVMGYSAFTMVDSYSRRTQLMHICDTLTEGKIKSKILSDCLAAQYVRTTEDKTMVTVTSLSLDGIKEPKIAVYGAEKALYLGNNGKFTELKAERDGHYGVFTLPEITAFNTAVIIAE